MNYIQARLKFRELSGRFDLVAEDGTDTGGGFFINEGRKFLDRLDETQKSWASCFRFIDVGRFSAQFPYCRAIKEVWAMTTLARWQLEKKRLQNLITDYLAGLPFSRGVGTPLYYSPAITRYIPESATVDTFEAFVGFVDIPAGGAHEFNSILINVPPDVKISVEIKGLFYSAELAVDTDENYWSAVHPSLLVMSAMRLTEVFNRNTQGVNDWTNSITTEMTQLGFDLVEELIAEVTSMGD